MTQAERPGTSNREGTDMTSVVLDREYNPAVDLTPEGEPWPFALVLADEVVLADHASDLVARIVDDYESIPLDETGDDKAYLLRVQEAIRAVSVVQALMLNDALSDGFDMAILSDIELTAMLGDRTIPPVGIDRWDHDEVPLVLCTHSYAPYTADTPPAGNVEWIDPTSEIGFLQSLSNLGLFKFLIHQDH